MKKDIRNRNDKGEYHGYNELYWGNTGWSRGNRKNNNRIGYYELHEIKTAYYIR